MQVQSLEVNTAFPLILYVSYSNSFTGVVGGIAVLAIIAGLVIWFNRRKRNQVENLHNSSEAHFVDGGYTDGGGYTSDPHMSQAPLKVYVSTPALLCKSLQFS